MLRTPATPVEASRALARMPLLVGTSCGWNAAGAALTFFPAVALTLFPMLFDPKSGMVFAAILLGAFTLPYLIYAMASGVRAVRARASDVVLHADGIELHGGPHHGRRIAWGELRAPYATVESRRERRFRLGRLLFGSFLMLLTLFVNGLILGFAMLTKIDFDLVFFGSPWKREDIDVWSLWLVTPGERVLVGTTDSETEAQSMHAAVESIDAVVRGRSYVEHAPAIPARIVSCPHCGAPVVPAAVAVTRCAYCSGDVPLPADVQQQAAVAAAMKDTHGTRRTIVAKLLAQPQAGDVNRKILLLAAAAFLAWPIGWAVVVPHALAHRFESTDAALLLMPLTAVLAASCLVRAGLTDRGALQLLTLGFGALAPRGPGEPPRCRRCQGPLAMTELGGVTTCAYCMADNVVGLDLRPTVSAARAEQASLDESLQRRASDKTRWVALSALAVMLFGFWVVAAIVYLVRLR